MRQSNNKRYSQNESLPIGGTDAEKVKRSLESRATVIYSTETSEIDSITMATKTKLLS